MRGSKCVFLISVIACSVCHGSERIALNPALLKMWDQNSSYPCRLPFKATYTKGDKSFVFFAAEHVFAPTEPSDNRLAILKREIESFKPSSIVVERPVQQEDFSPAAIRDSEKRCTTAEKKFSCGEPTYAAIVAAKNGARIIGGEVPAREQNQEALKMLSREEVLVYNSILVLSSLREEFSIEESKKKFLNGPGGRVRFFDDQEWSYEKFDRWLKKNAGLRADDVETSWLEPRQDGDASVTQKISGKFSVPREASILKAAEAAINSSDKSMVVYGAGHFVAQASVLASAFGPPKIVCLNGSSSSPPTDQAPTAVK